MIVAASALALLAALQTPSTEGADSKAAAQSEPAQTLEEALASGEVTLELRYRWEGVEEEAFTHDAEASTLRTVLGYRTRRYRGWTVYVEAENVADVGLEDHHDDGTGGSAAGADPERPVIADPSGTEVNQVYVEKAVGKTTLDLGRQELLLADERFLGPVGWRQNHQTFDALRIADATLPETTLTYLYLDTVHRVSGESRPMSGHVFHATRDLGAKELPVVKLALYAFFLDFDRPADRALSTSTVGLEVKGERALRAPWALHWEAEAAEQRDRGASPVDVDASYTHLLVGVKRGAVTLDLGAEILEGEPGRGRFTTPLATLHKFQGWADQFLSTPEAGIEDVYVSIRGSTERWRSTASYHDFAASSGSADYGTELDVEVLFKSPWDLELGAKAALYDSRGFSTDVRKTWLWGRWAL